jgi:hypothetical protein
MHYQPTNTFKTSQWESTFVKILLVVEGATEKVGQFIIPQVILQQTHSF